MVAPVKAMELLATAAELSSPDDVRQFAFAHPALLREELQEELRGALAFVDQGRHRLAATLDSLAELRTGIELGRSAFEPGGGPIERVWVRWIDGELDESTALGLAADDEEIALSLSTAYLEAVSTLAVALAEDSPESARRQAVPLHRLLLGAIDWDKSGSEPSAQHAAVALDWLLVANRSLSSVGDPRIFNHAVAAGARLVEVARGTALPSLEGQALLRLGLLHLDPYSSNRSTNSYWTQHQEWQARTSMEVGVELTFEGDGGRPMPEPAEALGRAESYLRQALELLPDDASLPALESLIVALELRAFVDGTRIDSEEVRAVATRALARCPTGALRLRLFLLETIDRHGGEVELTDMEAVLAVSLDDLVSRFSGRVVIDIVWHAVKLLQHRDVGRSLDLLNRAGALVCAYGDDDSRELQLQHEIALIPRAWAPDVVDLSAETLHGLVEQVERLAFSHQDDQLWLAGARLWLADKARECQDGEVGLRLVEEAWEAAPLSLNRHADAVGALTVKLSGIYADRLAGAGELEEASQVLTRAILDALDLSLLDVAHSCVLAIDELVHQYGYPAVSGAAEALRQIVLPFLDTGGRHAERVIRGLCNVAIAYAGRGPGLIDAEALLTLAQVAKGLRFAVALNEGANRRWESSGFGRELLAQIGATEREIAQGDNALDEVPEAQSLFLDRHLLTSYTRPDDQRPGRDPLSRLTNLQEAFDDDLNEVMLAARSSGTPPLLTGVDVRRAIDDRTVVLNIFVGQAPDGRAAIYVQLYTDNMWLAGAGEFDVAGDDLVLGWGGRRISLSPFAADVESVRSDILADPGLGPISRAAAESLEFGTGPYLGGFGPALEELRAAGKDHLCIVPHGPLHFYPLHLLGTPDRPLAADWIVTFLPNLQLLVPRRAQPPLRHRPQRTLASVGADFANDTRPGLEPLPQSLTEARAVARIFGVDADVGERATESALLSALTDALYVHVSTHGRHNVAAPAFQCIYLTPDAFSAGRLEAHTFLQFDLRGVDLLTLSACETALGRFDVADNIRGLPASFLLAGVATLVGTLWPVQADVSEHFFVALYEHLSLGASKLDAFAAAQRRTRAVFPQHRDWGAFEYVGSW